MNQSVLEKIETLERNLQKLKIETYFNLPEKQKKYIYPEKSLRRAVQLLRKSIWQERYAKKV